MINFFQLTLQGYHEEQDYLPEYFLRQQKIAEEKGFMSEEFFSKCFDVVERLKKSQEPKKYGKEIIQLSAEDIDKIEDQILEAVRVYDSINRGNWNFIFQQYLINHNLKFIFPFQSSFESFEKWEKLEAFCDGFLRRYLYFIGHLYPEEQKELHQEFIKYLNKLIKAQKEEDFKKGLSRYLGIIQRTYEMSSQDAIQFPDLELRRQHYEESKNVRDIFPYLPPQWKFHDWNKFISFSEVTMTTFIYIHDRLNESDQFEMKCDLEDFFSLIIEREKTTKYKKALIEFSSKITNYNSSSKKIEKEKSRKANIPSLKLFFKDDIKFEVIEKIQNEFKGLRNKEMAILIYLLNKNHQIISFDNNQRNKKSRIHFVRALTGEKLQNINGVNNYFEPITGETTVNERDESFLAIRKQLNKIVSNGLTISNN